MNYKNIKLAALITFVVIIANSVSTAEVKANSFPVPNYNGTQTGGFSRNTAPAPKPATKSKSTLPKLSLPSYFSGIINQYCNRAGSNCSNYSGSTGNNGNDITYAKPTVNDTSKNPNCNGFSRNCNNGSNSGTGSKGGFQIPTYNPPSDSGCLGFSRNCNNPKPTPVPAPIPLPTPVPNPGRNDPGVSKCNNIPYPRDIDGHWAEIFIRRMYDLCITSGYADGFFRPDKNITRAEFVKMVMVASRHQPIKDCYNASCGSPFNDLDMWEGPWVRAAWNLGIINGYDNKQFKPNQAISREEAVKVILKAFGYSPYDVQNSYFKDVSGWAIGWVNKAHTLGVVNGVGNGNFEPHRSITRAESSKVNVLTLEVEDTHIN